MNPQNTVPGTPQQQVIDRLKTAVNVLVTVSNNPSVDQLSAAIGFTLLLNKLGKHATAVFSGQVPSTIEFLKPEATIEKNTDSLRDFIVSLDKSKADKLRYKVEQNVVKIFITPYRTSLSEKDLEFSQGDFNVDAVVALGVKVREELDQAIVAHGRILHDATVITISAGTDNSSLGVINWLDNSASSLCEMLVGVGDAIQPGQLDAQIATAFLTGIVAETERFRNDKTTPKIMTLSAQLMAAGANQQLIATQLDYEVDLKAPDAEPDEQASLPVTTAGADGSLTIDHPESVPADELPQPVLEAVPEPVETDQPKEVDIAIDERGNLVTPEAAAEAEAAKLEAESQIKKPRHRIVEPLPPGGEPTEEEKFAGGPHPFVADGSEDGLNEPFIDPLSEPDSAPAPETDAPAATEQPQEPLPPVTMAGIEPVSEPTPEPTPEPSTSPVVDPAPAAPAATCRAPTHRRAS